MSFYGSVYYQLINSFYKTIISNSGINIEEFPDNSDLGNRLEIEAIGRKGVLNLDSGNHWIGITQEGEGEEKVVKFWHREANKNDANNTINDEDGPQGNVVNIPQGGYFQSDAIMYDSAGHIADVVSKWYKLPLTDTELELESINERIETNKENIEDLDDKVTVNEADIAFLKQAIGDWNLNIDPSDPEYVKPEEGTVSYTLEEILATIEELKTIITTQSLAITLLAEKHTDVKLPFN